MEALSLNQKVRVGEADKVYALPVSKGKVLSLFVQLNPNAGEAIVDAKVQVSLDNVNFCDITDEESGEVDEMVGIQVRDVPGQYFKVVYVSGVSEMFVIVS